MDIHRSKPPFSTLWESLSAEEKVRLADAAGTCVSYLSQVAHGHRNAGADLIGRLMRCDNRITFDLMRGQAA